MGVDYGVVMYIVVVLVFYLVGIVIMLIKYLRLEWKRMEEEVVLDFYFKGMLFGKSMKEYNVNSVVIRVFYMMIMFVYELSKNYIILKVFLEMDVWYVFFVVKIVD